MTITRDEPYEVDGYWYALTWNGEHCWPASAKTRACAVQIQDLIVEALGDGYTGDDLLGRVFREIIDRGITDDEAPHIEIKISLKAARCQECWGQGWIPRIRPRDLRFDDPTCPACGGSGIERGDSKR